MLKSKYICGYYCFILFHNFFFSLSLFFLTFSPLPLLNIKGLYFPFWFSFFLLTRLFHSFREVMRLVLDLEVFVCWILIPIDLHVGHMSLLWCHWSSNSLQREFKSFQEPPQKAIEVKNSNGSLEGLLCHKEIQNLHHSYLLNYWHIINGNGIFKSWK